MVTTNLRLGYNDHIGGALLSGGRIVLRNGLILAVRARRIDTLLVRVWLVPTLVVRRGLLLTVRHLL